MAVAAAVAAAVLHRCCLKRSGATAAVANAAVSAAVAVVAAPLPAVPLPAVPPLRALVEVAAQQTAGLWRKAELERRVEEGGGRCFHLRGTKAPL